MRARLCVRIAGGSHGGPQARVAELGSRLLSGGNSGSHMGNSEFSKSHIVGKKKMARFVLTIYFMYLNTS